MYTVRFDRKRIHMRFEGGEIVETVERIQQVYHDLPYPTARSYEQVAENVVIELQTPSGDRASMSVSRKTTRFRSAAPAKREDDEVVTPITEHDYADVVSRMAAREI